MIMASPSAPPQFEVDFGLMAKTPKLPLWAASLKLTSTVLQVAMCIVCVAAVSTFWGEKTKNGKLKNSVNGYLIVSTGVLIALVGVTPFLSGSDSNLLLAVALIAFALHGCRLCYDLYYDMFPSK